MVNYPPLLIIVLKSDIDTKLKFMITSRKLNLTVRLTLIKDLDKAIETDLLSVGYMDPGSNKLLVRAARLGNAKVAKRAMVMGATNTSLGLYQAAIGGHVDVVTYLVEANKKRQAIFGAFLGYTLKDSKSYNNIDNVKTLVRIITKRMKKIDKSVGLEDCKNHFKDNELLEYINDELSTIVF